MSGQKDTFVQLRATEHHRMMNTCQRIDNMEGNIRQNLSQTTVQMRRTLDAQLAGVRQRHGHFESALSQMSSGMQAIERKNTQRLNALAGDFHNRLSNMNSHLQGQIDAQSQRFSRELNAQRQEYTQLIQEQGEWFSEALTAQRQALEGQIRDLHQSMIDEKRSKQERAQQWVHDTQQLLGAIDQACDHEKFQPGELKKLSDELLLTESNLGHSDFEAAIGASQQTYLRAQTLRMTLERQSLEWDAYLNSAQRCVTELIAICDAQMLAKFTFDTDDGAQTVAGEIDYWTEGRLAEVQAQATTEQQRLADAHALSVEDFQTSISQMTGLQQQVESLAEQAKKLLIASQLRNNMAQTIEASLEHAGWDLTDAAYEGEDFRRAVHVKLENLAGDELVTIITPEKTQDETIRNRLSISFFDHSTNSEESRLERLRNLTQLLKEDGLDCSTPICAPGTENQSSSEVKRLDFDAVRNQKIAKKATTSL